MSNLASTSFVIAVYRENRYQRAHACLERIAFCPGYLREENVESRCGLYVIDLRSGDVVHWMRIEGVVEELYDVVALPSVHRPMALGAKTDEIRRVLTVGPMEG